VKIGGLQRVSLIDYPGCISAVAFLQGCNFRCPYCHNPELVNPALFQPVMRESDFFDFLKARRGKLDAVVITGGEPTIHEDLESFIGHIQKMDFLVKLDTNGSNPTILKTLIDKNLLSFISMDVKAPLSKYQDVVRKKIDTDCIKESIDLILKAKLSHEFRTTVVRSQLKKKDILQIARLIAGAEIYVLQKFVPSKTLEKNYMQEKSLSDPEFQQIKKTLESDFPCIKVR